MAGVRELEPVPTPPTPRGGSPTPLHGESHLLSDFWGG